MANETVDVVGIGAAAWDRFLVVPHHPQPDEKVRALREEECAGGTVATPLVALSRWGLRCRFVGILGTDSCSDQIATDLQREQIDTEYLLRDPRSDGRRSLIIVDNRNGLRTVISGPHHVVPLRPNVLCPEVFAGARVLHMDTTVDDCAVEAAVMARQRGLIVTLDAERVQPRTAELMRVCDYIIAPLGFAQACTGESKPSLVAYALHLQTGKPVIVTAGDRGCELASKDLSFHQPAIKVPVVDSTGAGDVFHAGFIYGLLAAWDLRKTIAFACWAAAATCREIGGRRGIPDQKAVREYL